MLSHHGNLDTGILSYMELTDLKFIPRRMYYITNVPKGEVRGNHAHREDQQYMFCVRGRVKEYMTGDDILLVFCSTKHDPEDYITDINDVLGGK